MIKTFVLDTNVLVSAYILANSKSRQAYNKALDSGVIVCSAATFDEFAETLRRSKFKKYLGLEHRFAAIKEFRMKSFLMDVAISVTACRDPKDNKFPELAVAAKATCIVTGDSDLPVLNPFREIPVVNARDFLNMKF